MEVRFKLKMGYLDILGLYVSKKDKTEKQKYFIRLKEIRGKINKIFDILLIDVLNAHYEKQEVQTESQM
jgi:RecA/RadA recombinase